MVVACDFQSCVNSALLPCPLQQSRQQLFAMATTSHCGMNRDGRDVQLIGHQPAAGHA